MTHVEAASEPAVRRGPSKLGEMVAARIEREIMQARWPVGRLIGSESELLERYQVSRAVLREAVRLLEHHGTATMRRGPGGGLIVRRPDARAVTRSVALYLDSERVTPDQLLEARMAIELIAVQFATERIDEDGIVRLRNALAIEEAAVHGRMTPEAAGAEDVHSVIAELSGNPTIQLFSQTLVELEQELFRAVDRRHRPAYRERFLAEHTAIVEAVVAGDVAVARHRMQRHLRGFAAISHPG